MPLISSVMRQRVSNFRLYCCSKKFQRQRKNVKSLLEQLQVCIFAEIVFGVRCTLNFIFNLLLLPKDCPKKRRNILLPNTFWPVWFELFQCQNLPKVPMAHTEIRFQITSFCSPRVFFIANHSILLMAKLLALHISGHLHYSLS